MPLGLWLGTSEGAQSSRSLRDWRDTGPEWSEYGKERGKPCGQTRSQVYRGRAPWWDTALQVLGYEDGGRRRSRGDSGSWLCLEGLGVVLCRAAPQEQLFASGVGRAGVE